MSGDRLGGCLEKLVAKCRSYTVGQLVDMVAKLTFADDLARLWFHRRFSAALAADRHEREKVAEIKEQVSRFYEAFVANVSPSDTHAYHKWKTELDDETRKQTVQSNNFDTLLQMDMNRAMWETIKHRSLVMAHQHQLEQTLRLYKKPNVQLSPSDQKTVVCASQISSLWIVVVEGNMGWKHGRVWVVDAPSRDEAGWILANSLAPQPNDQLDDHERNTALLRKLNDPNSIRPLDNPTKQPGLIFSATCQLTS